VEVDLDTTDENTNDKNADVRINFREPAKDEIGRVRTVALRAYICPNCRANIDRKTLRCEFCGTQFELEIEQP
jgi:hypothetical protein